MTLCRLVAKPISGCFLLLLSLLANLGCSRPEFGPRYTLQVVAKLEQRLEASAYAPGVDFRRWNALLANHRSQMEAASDPVALERVLNDALRSFGVSHLQVYAPERFRASKVSRLNASLGMGVLPHEGRWIVCQVIPDSPAAQAGLQPGDEVTGLPPGRSAKDLFGPRVAGRQVTVTWTRAGVSHSGVLTMAPLLLREKPSLRWLDGAVAVVRVPSFDPHSYDPAQVRALLHQTHRARGLILDLRNNPGGKVNLTAHFLSHFFPKDQELFHSIDRSAAARGTVRRRYRANPPTEGPVPASLPMVVLVTPNNGSGGELVPGVLQERSRAKVIGMRTMGAVLGADTFSLPLDWGVQLPIMEVLPPSGRSLEGRGVTPDVVLPATRLCPEDASFEEARRVLGR